MGKNLKNGKVWGIPNGEGLYLILLAMETLSNELATDHASFKTTATTSKTAIDELIDDHATFKTVIDDMKAIANQNRALLLYDVLSNPAFAIKSNFDAQNANTVSYRNSGTLKTLSSATTFDTGTSKTITGSNWGAAVLSADSSGTATVTYASGGGYASEALAIAALTDPGATHTILGYITIQAHASGFTAGTDALTTGTGGNVATATNYYNSVNPNSLRMGSAVSTSTPATLTAPKPTAAPATLSASQIDMSSV